MFIHQVVRHKIFIFFYTFKKYFVIAKVIAMTVQPSTVGGEHDLRWNEFMGLLYINKKMHNTNTYTIDALLNTACTLHTRPETDLLKPKK